MKRPVVHYETWDLIRRLAAQWGEPEWKVIHLAIVSLEGLAKERPQILEALAKIEGEPG